MALPVTAGRLLASNLHSSSTSSETQSNKFALYILQSLKDAVFMNKPELKKEGAFCTLDTGVVMENAPRELLSKEE